MTRDELAEDVKKLIADHITSVEQVEILLLLRSRSDREFSSEEVSEEIRTSVSSAAARLGDLEARGFLSARQEGVLARFRFDPATPWLRRAVELLADAYAERRYTVIDLIFSKPIDRLRLYADAFRLRKDKPDG